MGLDRTRELEQLIARLQRELAEAQAELRIAYRKQCTCSSWRLSTFYGEHASDCPVVA